MLAADTDAQRGTHLPALLDRKTHEPSDAVSIERWEARANGVEIDPAPQEVGWDVPLDQDEEHARYDQDQVAVYFTAATQAALVLAAFRAPYRGRYFNIDGSGLRVTVAGKKQASAKK